MQSDKQMISNTGLFYTCYKLSLAGWNVTPTCRSARGIDAVAYDHAATKFIGIEIKTLSGKNNVPLGENIADQAGDLWVIVNNADTNDPHAFILLADEVKKSAQKHEKPDGEISYWLKTSEYEKEEYKEAWNRLKILINENP